METTISTSRHFSENVLLKKALLLSGILSSLLYVVMNIFVPMQFEGYHWVSQTVSELSAIDAPTRQLWVFLAAFYILLFGLFGWGVLQAAGGNRKLRTIATLIIIYSIINVYWPPMHLRGVEPSLTDALHIVWSAVTVMLMMFIMGFTAAALRNPFRRYTLASIIALILFGILTGMEAPNIAANGPTPLIGVWERIMIAIFLLWIAALALFLLRKIKG